MEAIPHAHFYAAIVAVGERDDFGGSCFRLAEFFDCDAASETFVMATD